MHEAIGPPIFKEWLDFQRIVSEDISNFDKQVNGRLRGFYESVLSKIRQQ